MLYRFIVENFCSFRDRNEIYFYPNGTEREEHIADCDTKNPVLKTAVIYGPNASGKTKFIRAIDFARSLVTGDLNIFSVPNMSYRLDNQSIDKPSLFVFEMKTEGKLFQYAFALDFKQSCVVEESLYIWNEQNNSFEVVFSREQTDNEEFDEVDINEELENEEKATFDVFKAEVVKTPELLALTVFAKAKSLTGKLGIYTKCVYKWFMDLVILFPDTRYNLLSAIRKDKEETNSIYKSYFKAFGIDIKEISLQSVNIDMLRIPPVVLADIRRSLLQNQNLDAVIQMRSTNSDYLLRLNDDKELEADEVRFVHEKDSTKAFFKKFDESDGTMRLFDFIPLFAMLANENRVVLIDEIDRSMHTLLTRYMIEQFYNASGGKSSQLICTTHDVMLLSEELFANSEIWFVNKENEVSTIYPLTKFDLSKLSRNLERNYLLGRFEAIPKLY